ncbi:Eco57I restriction-modification methylase domain-containing protein [Paenarthrobacter nitroguajacolicus]|uniref:Eco57I restriction-modification methylase domain-containing protein n=1 Tax=Paenarthrobacter nitroguajacolicus TaxID=211146 RepID=UPI003AE949E5
MVAQSQQVEWLSLVETSGPFLTLTVLEQAFPQGLESIETPRRQQLRSAYSEWREAVDEDDELLPQLHDAWVNLVLTELLEFDEESATPRCSWEDGSLSVSSPDGTAHYAPTWIIHAPGSAEPRAFIAVTGPDVDLESAAQPDGWIASEVERMTLLCRERGVRVGIVTNGESWVLMNAPADAPSGKAIWCSRFWFQEPATLKAFQSLLGVRRCFGPTDQTLEALLDESLKHQEEVTDTLGEQVRRATEVLIQALDRADQDRNRELLRDVPPSLLYEASLTVMMRLVFVLCAEERGLFLLGDAVYDENLAVSTLRGKLAEEADQLGDEVLERRFDAWARLLAAFRAVYAGIEHEDLRLPAMGGSLFDPDQYPFLEGRAMGTSWLDTTSQPLPIDNRTVLLLLNSLQVLEQSHGALALSYRALDVEQIGHVYEGLLDHTVVRVPDITLGLEGSAKNRYPTIGLAEMESLRFESQDALVSKIAEETGRAQTTIEKALARPVPDTARTALLSAANGSSALFERIVQFVNLVRSDAWGELIVYKAHSFMVTPGADRRESGTHYTPRSLTEQIVDVALEPLVYIGPAEGKPREQWMLKTPSAILDLKVCDPAMGSGAFLVQACRYLAERLVESWANAEADGRCITANGEVVSGLGVMDPIPRQADERVNIARRLVALRCLYGVDINPLAVELAKLSIWLVTLSEGRPFGFLDHNLRSGDSLLGIHRTEQLVQMRLSPAFGERQTGLLDDVVTEAVQHANAIRLRLRTSRALDITDVLASAALDRQARSVVRGVDLLADAFMGEAVRLGPQSKNLNGVCDSLALRTSELLKESSAEQFYLAQHPQATLNIDLPDGAANRRPFHWPLEFPEVFLQGGFDAVLGNPPFSGGRMIGRSLGEAYVRYLGYVRNQVKGSPDLCAYFFLRALSIVKTGGEVGLLATKSITETGTRVVCLDQILRHGNSIRRAIRRKPWPGKASVVVSIVWIHVGVWSGEVLLEGAPVESITSALEADAKIARPHKLLALKGRFSEGQKTMGRGFELSAEERAALLEDEPAAAAVIFPIFTGQDLNQMPTLVPTRWIIYFRDWDESKARQYPIAFARLQEQVKPYRDSLTGQIHQKDFWKLWDLRPSLMREVEGHRTILASGTVAKYPTFRFVSTANIFNHQTKLYFLYEWSDFALLQSSLHQEWAYWNSGTMGASTLRYSTSTSLETWPMPTRDLSALDEIGRKYHQRREAELGSEDIGLTELYNRIHDPLNREGSVQELRTLRSQMDHAVLHAYGWSDVDPGHGFYELEYLPPKDCLRFTLSPGARLEVLRRLSKLNHERYKEEQDKRSTRGPVRRGKRGMSSAIPSLLDGERLAGGQ